MRGVSDDVGIGRVVYGGDLTVPNPDRFVDHLDHRCQAIGGARSRSHDRMLRRIIERVVDPENDIQDAADLDRCGNDHPLGTTVKMALQGLGGEQLAGALKHHVDTKLAPGNIDCLAMVRKREAIMADLDAAFADGRNASTPPALYRVKFQQMRGGRCTALVLIEMDDLKPVLCIGIIRLPISGAHCRAQRQTTDTPHAINADFHCNLHWSPMNKILTYS